uniref:ATP synthase subunit a n=1 Tax=Chaetoderma nitidulum TaxID=256131 RepID=D3G6C9_CHANT|nr:ATP synthase F0 subunit 6 [Chaetoderma nitidulum]ABM69277.1 ATP synthase F0 subunit 6 [Chaetoderma nitidulum]
MIMDIFSIFDVNSHTFLSMTQILWLISFWVIFTQNKKFWMFSTWYFTFYTPTQISFQQSNLISKTLLGFSPIFTPLFIMLILCNLTGTLPYVFSNSCHLILSLSLSSVFWMSSVLLSLKLNFKKTIAHLLPLGTPTILNPFLILVELVSLLIRPFTLAVRLMANMSAGHIVLSLVGTFLTSSLFSSGILIILLLIQVGYFLIEMGISLIQAYIFTLLVSFYSEDAICYSDNN